jgi:hypothetical protein
MEESEQVGVYLILVCVGGEWASILCISTTNCKRSCRLVHFRQDLLLSVYALEPDDDVVCDSRMMQEEEDEEKDAMLEEDNGIRVDASDEQEVCCRIGVRLATDVCVCVCGMLSVWCVCLVPILHDKK